MLGVVMHYAADVMLCCFPHCTNWLDETAFLDMTGLYTMQTVCSVGRNRHAAVHVISCRPFALQVLSTTTTVCCLYAAHCLSIAEHSLARVWLTSGAAADVIFGQSSLRANS